MKRYNNLFDKIVNYDNLVLADKKARKSKKNNYGIKLFDENKEENLKKLLQSLNDGTYHTSEYTTFKVYEPKERIIFRLPYYPDRIVHHAVMNVLEPIWRSIFTYNTYACIKNRGISACANKVKEIIKLNRNKDLFCLKIDIKHYYPSIDNKILKSMIRKKIKDVRLLNLLDEIIDSSKGLPVGNYISQYLANLYLSYFMHYVNEILKIKAVEYADDIVFFSNSKDELHSLIPKINEYFNTLKLEMKDNYQIFKIAENRYDKSGRGLNYVGFVFYKDCTLIRKSIKKNFCRKVHKLDKTSNEFKMNISPWLGWAYASDSKYLINKLLK